MVSKETILSDKIIIPKANDFAAVYFLIHNDRIIYVGNSWRFKARLRVHKSNKRMFFDSYYFIKISDHGQRVKIEKEYIKTFKPLFNFTDNLDYENGKKEVLRTFLSKWNSLEEVSEACGIKINDVRLSIYQLQGPTKQVIDLVNKTVLARQVKPINTKFKKT